MTTALIARLRRRFPALLGGLFAAEIVISGWRPLRPRQLPRKAEPVAAHDGRVVYLTRISKRGAESLVRRLRDYASRYDQ